MITYVLRSHLIKENSMNKSEFVDAIADAAGFTKADAAKAVDAMIDVVTGSLKKGDQISLVGFGSFMVKKRDA